ncbi:calmodulin CaM [Coleophoma cylindrospora]|uniref:Calmodulin n=1 Tax=Coleophoma cylindrospora TaxID=1849047 RepID=A0A3D8SDR7_9HELO|nr:calmodulin CaM [Coleophoma cylindrospora]
MSKPLSPEEVEILKEAFDAYDQDRGGNITVEEFGRVMRETGQNPTEEELAQIIKEVDLDGDGTINFDEFIAMMTGRSRHPAPEPVPEPAPAPVEAPVELPSEPASATDLEAQVEDEAEYQSAWKEFDPSLKSSITQSQLRQVLANLGLTASDAEIDEMINSVDDEDKISYKEFLEFVKRKEVDDIVGGY